MDLPPALLDELAAIARAAGAVVMEVYAGAFVTRHKADASPVTEADVRAEALITPALQALLPGVPVVAEEAMAAGRGPAAAALAGARFWLVDALDGTREFVQHNGEFTVNIALVEQGVPVAGVVFAPALGRLFAGAVGVGAWEEGTSSARRSIRARPRPATGLVLAASRSHGREQDLRTWLANSRIEPTAERRIGSSLKFGLLAAGEADVYPRLSRTMEWDTAAGHALLAAAGGCLLTLDGAPLAYGKASFENPSFVAWGGS